MIGVMATAATVRESLAALTAIGLVGPLRAQQVARVADLTHRAGDVARRLVGYGIVVGLDGTGDRSFGGFNGSTTSAGARTWVGGNV